MENLMVIVCIVATLILLRIILKISIKKAKKLDNNKELEALTDRFPENIQVAREILEMLENQKVTVEEVKNTKTSLYVVATDKIFIADFKNNYARIQTIAHECLHSIQDKTILMFNFIFSNMAILYWIVISILTIINKVQNTMLQIFILTLISLIKVVIRGYLEIDAMTKSRYLAEKYIERKKILNKVEREKLLKQYDEINKQGIPFTIFYILSNSLLWTIIYTIISII